MIVLNAVIRILDSYPFQLALCANMFAFRLPKRRRFWLRLAIWLIPMFIAFDLGAQHFSGGISENYFLERAILLLPMLDICTGLAFAYRIGLSEAIFYASGAQPAQNIMFNIFWMAKMCVGFEEGTARSMLFSLGIMLIVYSIVYLVLTTRLRDLDISKFSRGRMTFNAVLIIIFVIFFNRRINGDSGEVWIYGSYIIADIFALIIQFDLFHESELENKYAIVEQLLYSERKKQRITAENVELINRKCHDLKHQIAALKRMENGEERDSYIRKIEDAVMFYESAVKTGNETLDVILMDKLLYCQEHKIKLSCVSNGEKLRYLDTMDIYALFGNAIDNAIESVSCEPEESKRIISMRVGSRGQFLSIHIENYVGQEVKLSGGLPTTSKGDKQYHGFGMLSIKRIVEKYDGTMSIRSDDNLFRLDILIPVDMKSAS